MRLALLVTLLSLGCQEPPTREDLAGAPDLAPDAPIAERRRHLLVVTHTTGFRHGSIPVAEQILGQLGAESGLFDVSYCRDAEAVRRLLTPAGLAPFDGVFFANTTGDLGIPDLPAFLAWLEAGHAFLGAHSASDTYHGQPAYLAMLGGEFLRHGDQTEVEALVEEPAHPAGAPLAPRYRVFDEIYELVRNERAQVQVLLSLDRHPDDGHPEAGQPGDLLLAWHRDYGAGRVFYTALGHREEVWRDARFRQHLFGALRWALPP